MQEWIVPLSLAGLLLLTVLLSVKIVPPSEKYVVERLGRLHKVLGPGVNLIVPLIDSVKHRIPILERQLPSIKQDAITRDNVLIRADISVFYRIVAPENTVYRISNVDAAVTTTVAGIVRSEIGKIDLNSVIAEWQREEESSAPNIFLTVGVVLIILLLVLKIS
jgi:regulator of protease activity HflC (stomatin/prohibitin superfamily)